MVRWKEARPALEKMPLETLFGFSPRWWTATWEPWGSKTLPVYLNMIDYRCVANDCRPQLWGIGPTSTNRCSWKRFVPYNATIPMCPWCSVHVIMIPFSGNHCQSNTVPATCQLGWMVLGIEIDLDGYSIIVLHLNCLLLPCTPFIAMNYDFKEETCMDYDWHGSMPLDTLRHSDCFMIGG